MHKHLRPTHLAHTNSALPISQNSTGLMVSCYLHLTSCWDMIRPEWSIVRLPPCPSISLFFPLSTRSSCRFEHCSCPFCFRSLCMRKDISRCSSPPSSLSWRCSSPPSSLSLRCSSEKAMAIEAGEKDEVFSFEEDFSINWTLIDLILRFLSRPWKSWSWPWVIRQNLSHWQRNWRKVNWVMSIGWPWITALYKATLKMYKNCLRCDEREKK